MATLKDRHGPRAMAVTSLLPQVDRLTITAGDTRGDQAKFAACNEAPDDAIFIGADDDLIYPADYIDTILDGLERHPGCIVSFHGWNMDIATREPYADNYRCLENVWDDVEVHVAGTGVCAFRLDTIRPQQSWFESINADVWLAVHAQELGIRRVVLAHPSYWLGYSQMPGVGDDGDSGKPLARSVYAHTRHRTGTELDGSEGFERATKRLHRLIYG
jgi:hypothetical protein